MLCSEYPSNLSLGLIQGHLSHLQGFQTWWQCWSRDRPCTTTVQGQKEVEILRTFRYKMQKSTKNVAESTKFSTLVENRGRGIERRCLNLHRKFINNRFCACAVQMLLKMAVNAAICSTFEVQYGKSTSARTTAIGHFGYL